MTKKKDAGFEEQLAQLEEIVARLDSEELPLEKAIESYEVGIHLSLALNKTLDEAQRKIEMLTKSARGEYEAKPFDEDQHAQ